MNLRGRQPLIVSLLAGLTLLGVPTQTIRPAGALHVVPSAVAPVAVSHDLRPRVSGERLDARAGHAAHAGSTLASTGLRLQPSAAAAVARPSTRLWPQSGLRCLTAPRAPPLPLTRAL
ncbi:MAG: hypothetical protein KGN76_14235 [Acidobacteriota bacterium]|nr:hypothetical protein [Acidobacteriota bacterium]